MLSTAGLWCLEIFQSTEVKYDGALVYKNIMIMVGWHLCWAEVLDLFFQRFVRYFFGATLLWIESDGPPKTTGPHIATAMEFNRWANRDDTSCDVLAIHIYKSNIAINSFLFGILSWRVKCVVLHITCYVLLLHLVCDNVDQPSQALNTMDNMDIGGAEWPGGSSCTSSSPAGPYTSWRIRWQVI